MSLSDPIVIDDEPETYLNDLPDFTLLPTDSLEDPDPIWLPDRFVLPPHLEEKLLEVVAQSCLKNTLKFHEGEVSHWLRKQGELFLKAHQTTDPNDRARFLRAGTRYGMRATAHEVEVTNLKNRITHPTNILRLALQLAEERSRAVAETLVDDIMLYNEDLDPEFDPLLIPSFTL